MIRVRRVKGLVEAPSARQAGLPGCPAPDFVWDIEIASAVGKVVRKALVSAALGKAGSGPRLARALRDFHTVSSGAGSEGSVPESFGSVAVGWFTSTPGRRSISGLVFWFDKDPGRETEELKDGGI